MARACGERPVNPSAHSGSGEAGTVFAPRVLSSPFIRGLRSRPKAAISSLPLAWRIGCVFVAPRGVEAHDAVRADSSSLVKAYAFVGEPHTLRLNRGGLLRRVLTLAAEAVERAIRADNAVSWHRVAAVRVGPHELPDRARARRRRLGDVTVRRHASWRNAPNNRIDQIALRRHRTRANGNG